MNFENDLGKIEAFFFWQNDIVEKYFTRETSELHFSFYTISGRGLESTDFPTGSK